MPTPQRASDGLYREATRATWLGLVVNAGLGVTKLIAGLAGNSFALIADAINSLGDMFTSAVVLFALRVAQRFSVGPQRKRRTKP